jgi:uncharacterized membrane protein YfcA
MAAIVTLSLLGWDRLEGNDPSLGLALMFGVIAGATSYAVHEPSPSESTITQAIVERARRRRTYLWMFPAAAVVSVLGAVIVQSWISRVLSLINSAAFAYIAWRIYLDRRTLR